MSIILHSIHSKCSTIDLIDVNYSFRYYIHSATVTSILVRYQSLVLLYTRRIFVCICICICIRIRICIRIYFCGLQSAPLIIEQLIWKLFISHLLSSYNGVTTVGCVHYSLVSAFVDNRVKWNKSTVYFYIPTIVNLHTWQSVFEIWILGRVMEYYNKRTLIKKYNQKINIRILKDDLTICVCNNFIIE